jgi:hypothetical protein
VHLDGNLSIRHISNQIDYYVNGTKTTYAGQSGSNNYSDWINQTSLGQHMLNVTANFLIQHHDNTMSYSYHEVISKVIYFSIEPPKPSVSTTPSFGLFSDSMALLAIVSLIVILAVASVSLVYFKRLKPKPALRNAKFMRQQQPLADCTYEGCRCSLGGTGCSLGRAKR